MSDRTPLEAFLKWELKIESPSLAYAAKAATRKLCHLNSRYTISTVKSLA